MNLATQTQGGEEGRLQKVSLTLLSLSISGPVPTGTEVIRPVKDMRTFTVSQWLSR